MEQLTWTSPKLKHVVKSHNAAETLGLQEAAGYAMFLKVVLIEIYGLEEEKIPLICVTDNESLRSSIHITSTVENKRLLIDL